MVSPAQAGRTPEEPVEVGRFVAVLARDGSSPESNALPFQQAALQVMLGRALGKADAPGRVDHAMPGQLQRVRGLAQGVADEPGTPRQAGSPGDAALGLHAAPRDRRHRLPDALQRVLLAAHVGRRSGASAATPSATRNGAMRSSTSPSASGNR